MSFGAYIRFVTILTVIVCFIGGTYLMGDVRFSGGPSDGLTGAPGEGLCTNCHAGGPGDGSFAISGIPSTYDLNTNYTITVQLSDPGQQRWGFELTAIDENLDGAGSFTATDAINTQLSDNSAPARDYMKHTSTGTYNGTPDGPVTWQFDWMSPASAVGQITFYAAGNAANGSGTSGDFIYTTSESAFAPLETTSVPLLGLYGIVFLIVLMILSLLFVLKFRKIEME